MDDEPVVEVFYADPVDEDGNVIATAKLEVTYSGGPARATKVPHSELAIEDAPTIHVRAEDFPDG
jgi:hypothetical protein